MRDDLTLDVSAVLEAVTERTKVIFLCSPNNPTGRVISAASLRRVLRLGIPVAVDEAYVEFGDGSTVGGALVATHPNLLVVRTFSKAYGLAGLRVGYALCAEPVARLLHRVKLPWNVSTVALAAALAVLDDVAVLAQQRAVVREERAMLVRELGRMPGVSVFESDGNFVLLDIHETGMTADAIVQAMLHDGVFIRSREPPPPPGIRCARRRRATGGGRTHQRVVLFELRVGAVERLAEVLSKAPRGVSQPLLLVGAERDPFA